MIIYTDRGYNSITYDYIQIVPEKLKNIPSKYDQTKPFTNLFDALSVWMDMITSCFYNNNVIQ